MLDDENTRVQTLCYVKFLTAVELKDFLIEVHKLNLTILVTTAFSERNFSALKHIKTYLKNSMTQQCLNQCMVFHIHQDRMGALDLNSIAKKKISDIFNHKNVWTI